MTNPVIVQGVGAVALLIAVSVFQINKRKTMLALGMTSALLWAVHFFLLGAYTGSVMNLLGAGRCYAYHQIRPAKKNLWVLWAFMCIDMVATALTWQGPLSLLPFLGTTSGVIAYWQKKPKYIRRFAITSSPPWFIYNYFAGSYPGMVVEVLLMTSNLIGQYRFDLHHTYKHKLVRAGKAA